MLFLQLFYIYIQWHAVTHPPPITHQSRLHHVLCMTLPKRGGSKALTIQSPSFHYSTTVTLPVHKRIKHEQQGLQPLPCSLLDIQSICELKKGLFKVIAHLGKLKIEPDIDKAGLTATVSRSQEIERKCIRFSMNSHVFVYYCNYYHTSSHESNQSVTRSI